VGYSGGLDSTVLLHALAALGPRLPAPLAALHLDHGLQSASAQWGRHCTAVCAGLGVPLTWRRLDVRRQPGASLEAVARAARRVAYSAVLAPGEVLFTAHHQDDQAETLLLQLLRGSGLDGLAAMPSLAPLGRGWLARPLLGFSRVQLAAYAEARDLSWVDDPSNADHGFDRNYLRHRVLPLIAERWPAQARTLSRSARHCAEARDLIAHLVERTLPQAHGSRQGRLGVCALAGMDPALARTVLRHWIAQQGFPVPDSGRIGRILAEVIPAAADCSPLVAWPGAEVRRYRDDLFVLSPLPPPPGVRDLPWPDTDACPLPAGLGRLLATAGSAAGLRVRFGATGLRCRLPGAGHRTTLKNLFQGRGVPDWLRPYVPVVVRDGEPVAVAGVAGCEGPPGLEIAWEGHPFAGLLPAAGRGA
jgi:tRNA(Ile)-lysidine synthase